MSDFTASELAYLRGERRLGRVATVGKDGTPHVAPAGWSYNGQHDTIDVGGRQFARTKKYRDVKRGGRAAIVIDDLASVDPWRPRGVEVPGRAEVVDDPGPMIRMRRHTHRSPHHLNGFRDDEDSNTRRRTPPRTKRVPPSPPVGLDRPDLCANRTRVGDRSGRKEKAGGHNFATGQRRFHHGASTWHLRRLARRQRRRIDPIVAGNDAYTARADPTGRKILKLLRDGDLPVLPDMTQRH